jgi:hypothetical protein
MKTDYTNVELCHIFQEFELLFQNDDLTKET